MNINLNKKGNKNSLAQFEINKNYRTNLPLKIYVNCTDHSTSSVPILKKKKFKYFYEDI